jgi:peptidyl-prolyl cis-trans isomerase D
MLNTMREKTRIIMVLLAVAFVAWLVFDVGMGGTGQGVSTNQTIGSVNGTPISFQAWNEAYRQAYEVARQQNPGAAFSREDQRQLEDDAFEQLVQAHLLREEYRRHGITVSDREIADAVRRYPPREIMQAEDFQTDGRFDPTKYDRFLASNNEQTRQYLLAMESRWREDLPRFKLLQEVTSDIFVSDAKLWQIWRDQHDSARVNLLVIRPSAVVADASVRVTDEEVRAYYDAHRDEFRRPARAVVSFVALPRLPSQQDSLAVIARARTLRDSSLAGAAFEDVARLESADSASRDSGGALGTFAKGAMVPAFDRAAWALPIGQVSEPVSTNFGAHLIKVERRTRDSVTARHILIRWARIGARLDTLEARADSLDRYAAEQTSGTVLDSVARLMSLPVNEAPPIYQGTPYVLGVYRIPDVGVWAFEARVGETSPVIETQGGYFVFRLDTVSLAGVAPLEEVAPRARVAVMNQKKRAAAQEIARDAERRLASGQTMQQVADALRLTATTVGPFTRTSSVPVLGTATPAVGTAFRLRVGERSGMLESDDAYYFMQVERLVRADSARWFAQRDEQRAAVIQTARQLRVQQYLAALRRSADVKDRRAELLRNVNQDETAGTP